MNLFGGKNREEKEIEESRQRLVREAAANGYDDLVTKCLEELTRWAFPGSEIRRVNFDKWELWHLTDNGEPHIDVSVILMFLEDKPDSFECATPDNIEDADLTREGLRDGLRWAVCHQ